MYTVYGYKRACIIIYIIREYTHLPVFYFGSWRRRRNALRNNNIQNYTHTHIYIYIHGVNADVRQSSRRGWTELWRGWGGGGGGRNKGTLCAYTQRHNNNIPCVRVRVSILLCSSPDVNETEIEIWREKTHYYTKVVFTIFVYYNVGSNLASSPQRLSADISSPLRRPFRSERFNARRRRRPRRATKKPYNSNNNNNNTIVLYYTVAFVCALRTSRRAEYRRDFIAAELAIFKNGFHQRDFERSTAIMAATVYHNIYIYRLNNMLLHKRAPSIRIWIGHFTDAESNTIILLCLYVPTLHITHRFQYYESTMDVKIYYNQWSNILLYRYVCYRKIVTWIIVNVRKN